MLISFYFPLTDTLKFTGQITQKTPILDVESNIQARIYLLIIFNLYKLERFFLYF
jgi:hypothetical protein